MAQGNVALLRVGVELDPESLEQFEDSFSEVIASFEKQFENIWKVVNKEAGEYVAATAKDMSTTWDKTQKDLKSITTNALSGTVTALFKGDMDEVGDIWESAWDSMINKASSLWEGSLNKARRLPCSRNIIKGPEEFPGALLFKRAA